MSAEQKDSPDEGFGLLAEFNAGSEEAFARIVERYSGPLIRFLYRYTRDAGACEDLAQEAFLRLYRAAPDLKPGARLSTVLFKFAYNLAVDRSRRAAARSGIAAESLEAISEKGLEPGESATAPDRIYERNQRNAAIERALADLPETQRSALILRVYEGRSYAEIAEIMGITVPSVESLLFRARQGLAKTIKK